MTEKMLKKADFAGGCFWCVAPVFRETSGVLSVVSGYSGGAEEAPSYEDVKAQKTGHRETIEITYDEVLVSFGELLECFLESVDPFDDGGQFIDRGHSYTLAVYYREPSEKAAADAALEALEQRAGQKACVSVEPFRAFYPAEEYHQDWDLKHPEAFQKELEESGRACRLRKRK